MNLSEILMWLGKLGLLFALVASEQMAGALFLVCTGLLWHREVLAVSGAVGACLGYLTRRPR